MSGNKRQTRMPEGQGNMCRRVDGKGRSLLLSRDVFETAFVYLLSSYIFDRETLVGYIN